MRTVNHGNGTKPAGGQGVVKAETTKPQQKQKRQNAITKLKYLKFAKTALHIEIPYAKIKNFNMICLRRHD